MSIKKVFRTPHLPQIVSIYSFRSRFSSLIRSLPPPLRVKNRESPQCGSFPLQFNSYHAVFAFKQFLLHLNCHAHHGKCLLSGKHSVAVNVTVCKCGSGCGFGTECAAKQHQCINNSHNTVSVNISDKGNDSFRLIVVGVEEFYHITVCKRIRAGSGLITLTVQLVEPSAGLTAALPTESVTPFTSVTERSR